MEETARNTHSDTEQGDTLPNVTQEQGVERTVTNSNPDPEEQVKSSQMLSIQGQNQSNWAEYVAGMEVTTGRGVYSSSAAHHSTGSLNAIRVTQFQTQSSTTSHKPQAAQTGIIQ